MGVLPVVRRVIAVIAHPDDESFGLGAILSAFVDAGSTVSVVCLTHGEASTLGAIGADLAVVRERELRAAAAELGVESVALLGYADGHLDGAPLNELTSSIHPLALGADLALVFDEDGITGHPDHRRAMTNGRGYIALAAIIFGRYRPKTILAAALIFGFAHALQQKLGLLSTGIPSEFLLTAPFLVTIVVVAGFSGGTTAPAHDGVAYVKEGS